MHPIIRVHLGLGVSYSITMTKITDISEIITLIDARKDETYFSFCVC